MPLMQSIVQPCRHSQCSVSYLWPFRTKYSITTPTAAPTAAPMRIARAGLQSLLVSQYIAIRT
jgi:hypothetical protein